MKNTISKAYVKRNTWRQLERELQAVDPEQNTWRYETLSGRNVLVCFKWWLVVKND